VTWIQLGKDQTIGSSDISDAETSDSIIGKYLIILSLCKAKVKFPLGLIKYRAMKIYPFSLCTNNNSVSFRIVGSQTVCLKFNITYLLTHSMVQGIL
jgi:hypothetical protein